MNIEEGKVYIVTHQLRGIMCVRIDKVDYEYVLGEVMDDTHPTLRKGDQFCYKLRFITSAKEVANG